MQRVLAVPGASSATVALPRERIGSHRAGVRFRRRRSVVAILNIVTILSLTLAMTALLASGGLAAIELAMLFTFVVTLPWLSIGFWNAAIGLLVLRGQDRLARPLNEPKHGPITTKTAILLALRNEDVGPAFARLRAMDADLARHGLTRHFDLHVLSDTSDPEIAAREEEAAAQWRADPRNGPLHYRRRTRNEGFKAGNIREFVDRAHADYDFFLPLDADSLMSAQAIVHLVRVMEERRGIGILQSLVTGIPAESAFTRTFQFGMRHGMRAYTAGSAWWTGDCGPYWGHNALIRMAPFHAHCELPVLPGSGALSGPIMSHDQVEAVLMRRAGYEVRVLTVEGESFEENPPTLPDFIRRELRWCHGNMQYFKLLGMPGLKPTSRIQLALAILMYLAPLAWMAFVALGAIGLATGWSTIGGYGGVGLALFAVIISMSLAPKIAGLANVLRSQRASAAYGGRRRVVVGAVIELVLSSLFAPVVAVAIAAFALGLLFNARLDWRAQERSARAVCWSEATRSFAPQTIFGLMLSVAIAFAAPSLLPFAAPVLLGLVLAIPLAVLSASPALGRAMTRAGLCAVPEEVRPAAILTRLDGGGGGDPARDPARGGAAPALA